MLMLPNNPQVFLNQAAKRYPGCWTLVEQWRINLDSAKIVPPYCFVPAFYCDNVLQQILGPRKYSMHDTYCLTGLAAWRATQGIYRFDDDLYNELVQMDVGALPSEVLHKLPEWCVYFEMKESWASGAFVHIDQDVNTKVDELRILIVSAEGDFEQLVPFGIPLTGSLKDAVLKQEQRIKEQYAKTGYFPPKYQVRSVAKRLSAIVSMVLYICSVNADLSGVPTRPKAVKTKRGPRWFAPDKPTVWEVGYREGPALGRSLRSATEREGEATERSGVRPHIRRAHYHHYWTGSESEGNRELILTWLKPIFVNVKDVDDLTTTIRPVL